MAARRSTLTIDGGGSGSRARLHRPGQAPVTVTGEALSLTTVALEIAVTRTGALLDALPPLDGVDIVKAGLAGGGNAARAEPVRAALSRRLPAARVTVTRDLDLILCQLPGPGVALIAGTGAVAAARSAAGTETIVDGYGCGLGDRGGGAWIGAEALRLGLRDLDLIGRASPLLRACMAQLEISTPQKLAAALTIEGSIPVGRLAPLAPAVAALAQAGDPASRELLARAASELVMTVGAAMDRAGLAGETDILVAGGVIRGIPLVMQHLEEGLTREGRAVHLIEADPLDATRTNG